MHDTQQRLLPEVVSLFMILHATCSSLVTLVVAMCVGVVAEEWYLELTPANHHSIYSKAKHLRKATLISPMPAGC